MQKNDDQEPRTVGRGFFGGGVLGALGGAALLRHGPGGRIGGGVMGAAAGSLLGSSSGVIYHGARRIGLEVDRNRARKVSDDLQHRFQQEWGKKHVDPQWESLVDQEWKARVGSKAIHHDYGAKSQEIFEDVMDDLRAAHHVRSRRALMQALGKEAVPELKGHFGHLSDFKSPEVRTHLQGIDHEFNQKTASWLEKHPDASKWAPPVKAPSHSEYFQPYHLYNEGRKRSQRWSNSRLQEKINKAKKLDQPEVRGFLDEARARGLAVPEGAPPMLGKRVAPSGEVVPTLAGLVGALITGGLAGISLKSKKPLMEQEAAQTLKRFLRTKGVGLSADKPESYPHYSSHGAVVSVDPRSTLGTLAHEAGHATGTQKLLKPYEYSKLYGTFAMPAIGVGSAVILSDTTMTKDKEEAEKRLRLARALPLAAVLPYTPVLAEEGRASVRGVNMIRKLKGNSAALKAALELTPAFGTYAAATLGTGTAAYMAHRKLKRLRAGDIEYHGALTAQGRKKQNAKTAATPVSSLGQKSLNYVKDFGGGIDPFGTWTSGLAQKAEETHSAPKEHSRRKTIATAGGLVGGATVVPAAISGIVGGAKGLMRGGGHGVGGALASAGKGFVEGAAYPFKALHSGFRARGVLRNVAEKGERRLSHSEMEHLINTIGETPLRSVADRVKARGKNIGWREAIDIADSARKLRKGVVTQHLAREVEKPVSDAVTSATSSLGLAGAVGGLGARVQYDKGRAAEQKAQVQISDAVRAAQTPTGQTPTGVAPAPVGKVAGTSFRPRKLTQQDVARFGLDAKDTDGRSILDSERRYVIEDNGQLVGFAGATGGEGGDALGSS